MGAVNFSIDLELVAALKKTLPLDVFVETGTFRGDTVELVKDLFGEIHTVELSPEYYEAARARFAEWRHVDLVHGDSAAVLAEWAPRLHERSVLYFLDAHWCVADATAGEASQCPLLAEIGAVGQLNQESLIVIDDARLFLAPPPEPHEISHWPSLNGVIEALRAVSAEHQVMVLNDNIICFPCSVETIMREYGHAHGLDWLEALHKTRDYDNLRRQFLDLQKQLEKKDEEIRSLKADCNNKDEEIRSLKQICEEREHVIFQLDGRVKFLERTNLIGKALLLVRSALLLAWGPIRHRFIRLITPSLGVLRQYTPRPLRVALPPAMMLPAARLPKISVVTPSYNQAEYLARTLDSVLNQGYPNLEYIVQDGASKDGSADILRAYAARLTAWQSAPDGGQTNAINMGFRQATGEIMAWLNSDDILLPGALAYVAAYFDAHPEVDVIYGHRVIIDERDQEIGRWVMPSHDGRVLSWADFVPQETLFWRRRAWDKVGAALDENFHFAMDWDFLLRLRDSGAVFARVPYFLGAFRVHPQQKTMAEISSTGSQEMARLRERCHNRKVTESEIGRAVAPYLMRHVIYAKFQRYWCR